MKTLLVAMFLTLLSGAAIAGAAQDAAVPGNNEVNKICLLSGLPPSDVKYVVIKKVKYAKNGYGAINSVLPELFKQARKLNADAIISYNGGHRFGFWPWQFVRPVVAGVAVRWESPSNIDCEKMGGTFSTVLKSSSTKDQ